MNKFILGLIVVLASPSVASDFVSSAHFFPVVSRTDGLAGTRWLTSVQIFNPQTEDLTVSAHLSAGGTFETATLAVPAGETRNWDDFVGTVFNTEGNGALYLEADAESNDNRPDDCRSFSASMRIFTGSEEAGTFGQGVPSLDPVGGFLGDWAALFPSVTLFGEPSESGFRTNVGFWQIGDGDAVLRLRILDATGLLVWQRSVTVHRHDPFVMSLPGNLNLESATLVVDSLNGWVDCAVYISVVDNITGDASFLTSQLLDPDAEIECSNPAGGLPSPGLGRDAERLRSTFLGESR